TSDISTAFHFQRIRWGLRLGIALIIITLPCLRYVLSVSAWNGRRYILGSSGLNLPTRVCTWCLAFLCWQMFSYQSSDVYHEISIRLFSTGIRYQFQFQIQFSSVIYARIMI
ncbi:Unknown protein, partial [Striga hermonthica]